MTTEQTINDVRVVFRDTIPAKFGWGLATAMNRLLELWNAKVEELQGDGEKDEVFVPGGDVVIMMQEALTLAQATQLIRGAVESWDFDGDLDKPDCCDGLATLQELVPLVTKARTIYYAVSLSGE